MIHTFEKIEEAYKRLPDDIKGAIAHLDTSGTIGAIGNKHGLHIDQIGDLADATALVMIGLEPISSYIPELEQRLKLQTEKVKEIAEDINLEIFIQIRESIQKMAESKSGGIQAFGPEDLPNVENKNLFEQKMGQLFRIPREEVDLDGKKHGPDPYLESI